MPVTSTSPTRALPTASFARDLAQHGSRPALLTGGTEISYSDLAHRVTRFAETLGGGRRLVLIVGSNTVDVVVTYLAALSAGNPVLLAPGDSDRCVEALIAAYDPDVVAGSPSASLRAGHQAQSEAGWRVWQRRVGSIHTLHPELALLLSTSGSTGSPKLVRLSHANLESNAEAIATYLEIDPGDRAISTLPISYCYGLSVINSHLLRGAGVILTDLSVTDEEFWRLARRRRATSFAAVPYTFDLLDRVGFGSMRLPHLRYITQAGGRLAPDRVRRYAALGRRRGFRLFVMYGQTEATARMAYLPPDLAEAHPETIGVPIPGGTIRLDSGSEDADEGELVYGGPNVMLGYAHGPDDLSLGRTVSELRTGDIARRRADGLLELVGRRCDFAKILGLRIDPARVEAMLAEREIASICVARSDELLVAVAAGTDPSVVRRLVAAGCRLPPHAINVRTLPELPRLFNGKPDYDALRSLPTPAESMATTPDRDLGDLRLIYAEVLERADVTDDSTFVGLGGDSLSYVEMSVRLERALGHLPRKWDTTPIRDLRPAAPAPPTQRTPPWTWLETSVAIRAIAAVLIVGTHAQLFAISGGAHLLLGVVGFNLARFHLTDSPRSERVRGILRTLRRVVLVSIAWIGLVYLVTNDYALRQVFLLHYLIGPLENNNYWFIEAFAYITLAVCGLLAVPSIDRLERRYPFVLPMSLVLIGLVTRYQLIPGVHLRTPAVVFWLVALGWAIAKSTSTWHRVVTTLAAVATVPGFFQNGPREAVVLVGLVLLAWVPRLPSVRVLNALGGLLAGASLYIYLTHWQVYPLLNQRSALLATLASLAFGVAFTAVLRTTRRRLPVRALRWTVRPTLAVGPTTVEGDGCGRSSRTVTARRRAWFYAR